MSRPEILTLEQILSLYPPKEEIFEGKDGSLIKSQVSRAEEKAIVYTVPGSTSYLKPPLQEK